jgi:hypothetical protein
MNWRCLLTQLYHRRRQQQRSFAAAKIDGKAIGADIRAEVKVETDVTVQADRVQAGTMLLGSASRGAVDVTTLVLSNWTHAPIGGPTRSRGVKD